MSGTQNWVKSLASLACSRLNPAIGRMASDLKVKPVQVVGHLTEFWHWASNISDDGDISRFTERQIARNSEWTGNETRFVEALVRHGFLVKTTSGLIVEEWWNIWGGLSDKRLIQKERQRVHREKKAQTSIESEKDIECHRDITRDVTRDVTALEESRLEESRKDKKREGEEPSLPGSQNASKTPKTDPSKFVPPTVQEVETECSAKGYRVDPAKYHATRSSTGWKKPAGSPIVDWKADLMVWNMTEKTPPEPVKTEQKPEIPWQELDPPAYIRRIGERLADRESPPSQDEIDKWTQWVAREREMRTVQ